MKSLLIAILTALPSLAQAPVKIPFDADIEFLKLNYQMNLGEVLGVAVNSKGTIVVINHPGSATTGPLYGNATTQLLEFDSNGKFVHELGRGVYGLGYAHSVRFDKYDNLWVVDKGTHVDHAIQSGRDGNHEPRPPPGRARTSPST